MVTARETSSESALPLEGVPTVLCVDDEPLARRALDRLLRKENYALHFAGTPREALDFLQDHPVDLVITDQRMPEMSGLELLREVQKASPGTPGLLLTAYPESVFVDEPSEAPRPPLFSKPWNDDILLEGIEEMLYARGGAGEGGGVTDSEPVTWRSFRPPESFGVREEASGAALRTIVVPLDGSLEAELALESVLPLLEGDPARIILLRIMSDPGLHRDVYAYLQKTRERLSSQGIDATADVRWGDPAEQILLHARHARADLIVLPLHRQRGLGRFFRRNIATKILRRSQVPVLFSRSGLCLRSWKRILVPLEGGRAAESVLPETLRLAKKTGAAIDVVGVEPGTISATYGLSKPRDPVPYLTELTKLIGFEEVEAEPYCLVGDPAREILRHAQARGVDLICMTTRGRSGLARRVLGSVTEEVLRSALCPVYVRRILPA